MKSYFIELEPYPQSIIDHSHVYSVIIFWRMFCFHSCSSIKWNFTKVNITFIYNYYIHLNIIKVDWADNSSSTSVL